MSNRRFQRRFTVAAAMVCLFTGLTLLSSCASYPVTGRMEASDGSPEHLVLEVPFFPDDSYRCGPASLASIMSHAGVHRTKDQIARETYSKSAKGTLPSDLVWYARSQGLSVEAGEGSWDELVRVLQRGRPVVVFVEMSSLFSSYPHFMVVVGYGSGQVYVYSGETRGQPMNRSTFLSRWRKLGQWMMYVKHGGRPGTVS